MPKIRRQKLPRTLIQHLSLRIRQHEISLDQMGLFGEWCDTNPEVPEGDWFKWAPLACPASGATSSDFQTHELGESMETYRIGSVARMASVLTGNGFGERHALDDAAHLDRPEAGWDYPTMIVTLDSKRRLTVPAALAPAAPGDYFDAQFDPEEDTLVFRRLATNSDWLAVLKECPVSMDDVPPRRRELPRRRKL